MSDSRIQLQILVKGKVQRVGFRDKVEDLAVDLGLTGYIQNRPPRDAGILVEGEKDLVHTFLDRIRAFPPPVLVKSVSVTEHPFEGTWDDFLIIRGDPSDELAERLDSAIYYLHGLDTKQDQMLEKQDTAIQLHHDTLSEIKGLRQDFGKTVTEEMKEIRDELRVIRSALIQAGIMKIADV